MVIIIIQRPGGSRASSSRGSANGSAGTRPPDSTSANVQRDVRTPQRASVYCLEKYGNFFFIRPVQCFLFQEINVLNEEKIHLEKINSFSCTTLQLAYTFQ